MTIDQTGNRQTPSPRLFGLTGELSVAGCAPFRSIPAKTVSAVCRHLQRQACHRISEETGRESPLPDLPFGRQNLPFTTWIRRSSIEPSVTRICDSGGRMGSITSRPSCSHSTSSCRILATPTWQQSRKRWTTSSINCNIPPSNLPAKVYRSTKGKTETVRYFVDKFPLFLSPAAVVHFTFVSAGGSSRLDEFRTHLRLYRGLFRRLKEVRMVFIHQDSFHVPAAETCFRAALKAAEGPHIESAGLLRYFELRQAWERQEYERWVPKSSFS